MKCFRPGVVLFLLVSVALPLYPQSLRKALSPSILSGKLAGPHGLHQYVTDGKLTLSLHDAVLLALLNNSNVRVEETQIENQKMAEVTAHAPFDPLLTSSLNINRNSSPGYTALQGVGQSSASTLTTLNQTGQLSYSQTFETGTNVQAIISSNKNSNNSSYLFFNPYYSSYVDFQFTQPLLRGAGLFANRAPIIIARRHLTESEDSFKAQVSAVIYRVIQQYWAAVQARDDLEVSRQSLKLAQASYQHDEKALKLGALPPLDIYRSRSEVAARKVDVIQAQSMLSQADETLRFSIGANQDPGIRKLPLQLTEDPLPHGKLKSVVASQELARAMKHRPEIAMMGAALDADRAGIRLAHNQMRPNLTLTGFYQSEGLGGNQYSLTSGQLVSKGGFGSSFGQVFGFGYPGYGASLTLEFPIRNHSAEAALGDALVARSHDQYSLRQVHEQIVSDVSNAIENLREAKLALTAARSSYHLAQKTLQADEEKYKLGAETNFFVLDSQTRLAQAESALVQTEINYRVAVASLSYATGDILTPWNVQVRGFSKGL